MAIKLQVRDNLIEATYQGNITAIDLQQQIEIFRDLESRLDVSPDRIADLSNACGSELLSSDVVLFAAGRESAKLKNRVKSAIIAPSPVQYGLARMFMAHNKNPSIEIMIFRDAATAYEWLGQEPQSDVKPIA